MFVYFISGTGLHSQPLGAMGKGGGGREGGRWEWWRSKWNGMVCDSCGSGPRQRPDLLGTITDREPSVLRGG